MSKRLQVLLEERDFAEIRDLASRERMSVADWVRRALLAARRQRPAGDAARKIASVRVAVRHSFPSGDVEQMLAAIESGYSAAAPAPLPSSRSRR